MACGQSREPHGQASGLSRPQLVSIRSSCWSPKTSHSSKARVGIGTYLDIANGKFVVRKMLNLYPSARAQALSLSKCPGVNCSARARTINAIQGTVQMQSWLCADYKACSDPSGVKKRPAIYALGTGNVSLKPDTIAAAP